MARIVADSAAAGSVAYYHNHAWQVLEKRVFDHEQELERVYQNVWSPRYIDAWILRDACDPATGAMLLPERLFYLSDANYNVTGVVGESPASPGEWRVVEHYVYDPYGRVAVRNGDPAGDPNGRAAPDVYPEWSADPDGRSDRANTTLYTGRALDPESGLYHYRARYYAPGLSKFMARDPLEYSAGESSLYRYCANNPVLYVGPIGLLPQPPQTAKQGLGSPIFEQYMKLAIAGTVIVPQVVTGPLNWFGYHYQFDDDGHVAKDTKLARRECLANLAKSLNVSNNGTWWTITRSAWESIYPHAKDRPNIAEDPGIESLVMQPSFWLGGAHDIEATGRYDVRFLPAPGDGWEHNCRDQVDVPEVPMGR